MVFDCYDFDFKESNDEQVRKLLCILHNANIKEIQLSDSMYSSTGYWDNKENFLQLLVPESPKAIELNQRLEKEISDEQRN